MLGELGLFLKNGLLESEGEATHVFGFDADGNAGKFAAATGNGGGGGGGMTYVVKSADETVSNTTLQDDDHLFFTADANSTYAVKIGLVVSVTTELEDPQENKHFKLKLEAPIIAQSALYFHCPGIDPSMQSHIEVPIATSSDSTNNRLPLEGSFDTAVAETIIRTNETGGVVKLQWSQYYETEEAKSNVIHAGSYIAYQKLN